MRLTRVHVPPPLSAGSEVTLPQPAAHHVVRVLRLRTGATLVVFDGKGDERVAQITRISGNEVSVRLGEHRPGVPESPLDVTLVQGISRSERMDWTLQKATELGVRLIVPVLAARSVVRLDERQAQHKVEHWRAVLASACEQCGRSRVPDITRPVTLREHLAAGRPEGLRLVLNPLAPISLPAIPGAPHRIELLIGPEGGLDDAELAMARDAGFTAVRLGPRVLRTETAAVVALSVLQAMWGDLR